MVQHISERIVFLEYFRASSSLSRISLFLTFQRIIAFVSSELFLLGGMQTTVEFRRWTEEL